MATFTNPKDRPDKLSLTVMYWRTFSNGIEQYFGQFSFTTSCISIRNWSKQRYYIYARIWLSKNACEWMWLVSAFYMKIENQSFSFWQPQAIYTHIYIYIFIYLLFLSTLLFYLVLILWLKSKKKTLRYIWQAVPCRAW